MKDQIQFETNGLTVLAMKVPTDSSHFIVDYFPTDQLNLWFYIDKGCHPLHNLAPIKIPEGNWKLHAVTDTITEDQAEVLVKEPFQGCYFDYRQDFYYWSTAKESFETYLENRGIDPADKWVLLIKQD